MATKSKFSDVLSKIAFVIAVLLTLFQSYTALFGVLTAVYQRAIHLGLASSYIFLFNMANPKEKGKVFHIIINFIGLVASAGSNFYICLHYAEIQGRLGITTELDMIFGALLLVAILIMGYESLGWALPTISVIFLLYGLFGHLIPGALSHQAFTFKRLISFLYLGTEGVFGSAMSVSATFIFIFILFGAFLEKSGAGQFFVNLALTATGRVTGGPALAAVASSALMGTISGSGVSNVVTTGTFTIPLMKSRGYKPQFAGGVEAVASTGGQILPPVMGSGAFLMVAFTEQKYIAIVIAAVIPALLYYWGCAVAVMSQTEIAHVTLMDPKDIPKSREVMKDGWIYLLIIAVLLYCLLVAQYSPLYSALWATCAVPVVMLFDKKKRFTLKTIPSAMVKSGFSAMSIVIGCACAGIVVGMVSITGIGVIFGDMMIQAAHSLLFPSLLFTAITCIVLGMGLPTTAAYVIAASILAPSLIKLGLAPLTAHLFVFYFACLSAITPPVALAAYAGAGIAKTNPMTTAVEACKLGFAGFMVPFAFCYNPAMMMQGSVGEIISVAISAIIGVAIMSAGFQGWLLWKLNWLERIVFIAGGLLMFSGIVIFCFYSR